MNSDELDRVIQKAIAELGESQLIDEIEKIAHASSSKTIERLTIVVNKGVHHLPQEFWRGEVFYASEGSMDFSSKETVEQEFLNVLKRLTIKLKENAWNEIYLVPFGPSNLSMLIKLLVYRVTHIETVDVFHMGGGRYIDLEIQLRPIVTST